MTDNLNARWHRRVEEAWDQLIPEQQARATELLAKLDAESAWWTQVGLMLREADTESAAERLTQWP